MPVKPFEASMRRRPCGAVIDLHGEIDGSAEDDLNAAYAEAEGAKLDVILLHFADVTYINSTGIALIVSLIAKARESRRTLRACCLSDHYQAIFTITRLIDYVTIFPDEAGALPEATTNRRAE